MPVTTTMMSNNHSTAKMWIEKYRPRTLAAGYIWHDTQQQGIIQGYIAQGEIQHLLFHGIQGTGKTTLSNILISELGVDPADVLRINASDENSVDTIRDKITNFAFSFAIGKFRVVQLEEMDYLSLSAQAVLRHVMEECESVCRFIGTCNAVHKIMPALRSRFAEFAFKRPDINKVCEYAATILANEGVQTDPDTFFKYVNAGYPDVRKVVGLLQQHSVNGVLQAPTETESTADYKLSLIDIMNGQNGATAARELVCRSITSEGYDELYRFLYDNLHLITKFGSDVSKYELGIVTIARYLERHAIVSDPEINVAALFIELGRV